MIERHPPFVIGILASLGIPTAPLPKLKDRRFVTVTRTSFPIFKRHVSASRVSLDEATWTGLEYLVDSVADNPGVKVKVFDVSARELIRDFQRAPQLNQSAPYKKTYDEGHDTFGGEPFRCLVADYSFMPHSPEHVEILENLSQLAAACWSPLFAELDSDAPDAAKWLSFRKSNAAAFLFPQAPRAAVDSPVMASCNPAYRIAATVARGLDPLQNTISAAQHGTKGPTITLAHLLFLGSLMAQSRSQLRMRLKSRSIDVARLPQMKFTWDGCQPGLEIAE